MYCGSAIIHVSDECAFYNLLLLCLSVGTRSDNGKIVVRWMCVWACFRDVLVGDKIYTLSLHLLSSAEESQDAEIHVLWNPQFKPVQMFITHAITGPTLIVLMNKYFNRRMA